MTRNKTHALSLAAALLLAGVFLASYAQEAGARSAPAPAQQSQKIIKTHFVVMHTLYQALQVRSLVDIYELHTFIPIPLRSATKCKKIVRTRAATSTGTKSPFGTAAALIVALKIKGKPYPNQNEPQGLAMIRPPAVAGRFYPDDPRRLSAAVDSFLGGSVDEKKIRARACLVPHAGYVYSGRVAGCEVYRRAWGKFPRRVILLGPRHFPRGAALAILSRRGLADARSGMAPIDRLLAEEIVRAFQ